MARSKSSNQWMQEHVNDEYVKKAKALGYRSRATFKLVEILEKDKIDGVYYWDDSTDNPIKHEIK